MPEARLLVIDMRPSTIYYRHEDPKAHDKYKKANVELDAYELAGCELDGVLKFDEQKGVEHGCHKRKGNRG